MTFKRPLSTYRQVLLCSCVLLGVFSVKEGRGSGEQDIIIPCRPPILSSAQAGERITAQLFDYAQLDQAQLVASFMGG